MDALPFHPLWLILLLIFIIPLFLPSRKAKSQYQAKTLLNGEETKVLAALDSWALSQKGQYRILIQVALEEVISPIKGLDNSARMTARNQIREKRLDFLIVDQSLKAVCAVEHQGSGHYGTSEKSKQETKNRDLVKANALEQAGIPLVETFKSDTAKDIISKINKSII